VDRDELIAYYALSLTEGIGAKGLMKLYEYAGGAQNALRLSKFQIKSIDGFGEKIAESFASSREVNLQASSALINSLPTDTSIITYYDDEYPYPLKNIYSSPALLFLRGNRELLSGEKNLAIVGTRKMTDYGKRATEELGEACAKYGVTVVSGFAHGVDTCAHHACFDAGGVTIAVLGSGINHIYPSANKSFAKKLIDSGRGLIISELPYSAPPDAKNFPWRNRIVSGLSKAVVVIESEEKGGSMITGTIALDQNKDIFALPGDISRSTSKGPNKLIRESRAKLFRSSEDIFSDLGWTDNLGQTVIKQKKAVSERRDLTLIEGKIVGILDDSGEPLHIDIIAERSGLEVQVLLVQLLELEFKDLVRQMGGKYFTTIF
jgi:DNA processing protein